MSSAAGVLLNHMFPVWLITLCLVCLLTYLTYKTLGKGLRLYHTEQMLSAVAPELHLVHIDQHQPHEEHHCSVHNLLRSISEEPDTAVTSTTSVASQLPPIAETRKQAQVHLSAETISKDGDKQQEIAMTAMTAQPAEVAQSHLSEGVFDKFSELHRLSSHGSAQSLRIKSEADGQTVRDGMLRADDTNAQDLSHVSSSVLSDTQPLSTASSDSINDSIPLLPNPAQGSKSAIHALLAANSNVSKHTAANLQRPEQGFATVLAQLPVSKLMTAVGMWGVFAILQLVKGQLRTCSSMYWLTYTCQACFLLTVCMCFVNKACASEQYTGVSHPVGQEVSGDQSGRSSAALVAASAAAIIGGALAATIGMGGGVVMGPLLLTLQVHPLATAATSTLMILFSSSAATLSFTVAGSMNVQYALIYGTCNFMASFAGVFLIGRSVRRTGKSAVIVILLACIMAVGATASAIFGGLESLQDLRTGENLTFRSICR